VKTPRLGRDTNCEMSNDRKLVVWLLVLAGLAHAVSLQAPWVGAWVEPARLSSFSGAEVLGQGLQAPVPWAWLALAHVASGLTWLAAWKVPRHAWVRGAVLVALAGPTLVLSPTLVIAGVWNGADAWPQGLAQSILRALAQDGWWVLPGVAAWGVAQLLYVLVLLVRARATAQQQLQIRWARRTGTGELGASLPADVLRTLPSSLRRLAVDAQRLRVDLDAPVRPIDHECRMQLLDLALALGDLGPAERERLRRAGLEPGRVVALLATPRRATAWLPELTAVDAGLHRLVQAVVQLPSSAYR
jgi:hypothetical protein